MNEDRGFASQLDRIDSYSILRDVLKNLWVILLGAIAVGLIINMSAHANHQRTYSTKATFVVSSRTSSNYAYTNLSAASSMASTYTNILNSSLMKKRVCQDIGMESFNATAKASVIEDTNLMTLTVTSDSPYNAYRIIRSIMSNTHDLTRYISTDMVMGILQDPPVPKGADKSFSALRRSVKAALVGAAALTAVFMFLSYRKETIKSEKDMEDKLDAKSLGTVYHDPKYSSFSAFVRGKKSRHLITDLTARFQFVERYKKIGAAVSSAARSHDAKIILITSVREHEGKSTVASNIALALALQSHKVLLIDGDMRRPTLSNLFLRKKDKLQASLGELLQGRVSLKDALYYDKHRHIYLLLNRKNYVNSTDIISSQAMKSLLNSTVDYFDYIIIDSPPMSLMADAEALTDQADMSILVVQYDSVLAPDLNDAIDSLRDCRAHFAGCILNDVRTLPGSHRTVVGYGGYGRYKNYRHYGNYSTYGRYGKYGKYNAKSNQPKNGQTKTSSSNS